MIQLVVVVIVFIYHSRRFMEYGVRPQSRIGIKQFTMQGNGHEASLAPVHDLIVMIYGDNKTSI